MNNMETIIELVKDYFKYRIVLDEDIIPVKEITGEIKDIIKVKQYKVQVKCYFIFIPFWVTIKTFNIDENNDAEFQYREAKELLDKLID